MIELVQALGERFVTWPGQFHLAWGQVAATREIASSVAVGFLQRIPLTTATVPTRQQVRQEPSCLGFRIAYVGNMQVLFPIMEARASFLLRNSPPPLTVHLDWKERVQCFFRTTRPLRGAPGQRGSGGGGAGGGKR